MSLDGTLVFASASQVDGVHRRTPPLVCSARGHIVFHTSLLELALLLPYKRKRWVILWK